VSTSLRIGILSAKSDHGGPSDNFVNSALGLSHSDSGIYYHTVAKNITGLFPPPSDEPQAEGMNGEWPEHTRHRDVFFTGL
jgi:hypothetical protein